MEGRARETGEKRGPTTKARGRVGLAPKPKTKLHP